MLSEIGLDKIRETQHSITIEGNTRRINPHIVTLNESAIEIDLITEYSSFKRNKEQQGFCHKLKTRLNFLCGGCLVIMKALWLEVIPKHFCGMSKRPNHNEKGDGKQKLLFEQFRKKRARFFLIVLGTDCGEQEIQQAYQTASFVTTEGQSLSLGDLLSKTSCVQWSMPSLLSCKKYLIIFMKFDCFDHLLRFGQLSQSDIISMDSRQKEMELYKKQIEESFRKYQQIERGFVGSYVQKEDKLLFE